MSNKITVGCDPEVFLTNAIGNLVSSIGRVGGSKSHPRPLPIGKGYAVQEDNVALEFNIPPAKTMKQFSAFVNNALNYLSTSVVGEQGLSFSKLSAAVFDAEQLNHPRALEFGCEPDFNAWTNETNPRPKAENPNLRSCGGHVHIGFDREQAPAHKVIQMCDLFMGVPSVIMDTGDARKELYGKAGAFRLTRFGCEYRTMSNFWIFDESTTNWVFRNTQRAVDAAVAQMEVSKEDEARIITAINNNDRQLAYELAGQYSLEIVNVPQV